MLHMQHVQRYGKIFHGQMLKSATDDYDKRHVIAFRPISTAARSWSYDSTKCCIMLSSMAVVLTVVRTSLTFLLTFMPT